MRSERRDGVGGHGVGPGVSVDVDDLQGRAPRRSGNGNPLVAYRFGVLEESLMSEHHPARLTPTILVVFGPTGDLMARKVVPSLFYLRGQGPAAREARVVGFGRREWGDAELRAHVRGILAERAATADPADVEDVPRALRVPARRVPRLGCLPRHGPALSARSRRSGACAPTSSSTSPCRPRTTR